MADEEKKELTDEEKEKQKKEQEKAKKNREIEASNPYILSPDMFMTPELGDFYLGAVDTTYLKKLDSIINNKDPKKASAFNAAYYTENPPMPASNDDTNTKYVEAAVVTDAIYFTNGFVTASRILVQRPRKENEDDYTPEENTDPFIDTLSTKPTMLQLYGIKQEEEDIWCVDTFIKSTVPVGENPIDGDINVMPLKDSYVYPKSLTTNKTYNFIYINGNWHYCSILDSSEESVTVRWIVKAGNLTSKNDKLRDILLGVLSRTESSTDKKQSFLKSEVFNKKENRLYLIINKKEDPIKDNLGFSEESIHHLLRLTQLSAGNKGSFGELINYSYYNGIYQGTAYLRIDNKWINLSKLLLCEHPDLEYASINKDAPEIFNTDYDIDSARYADAFIQLTEEFDDRASIQKAIFGEDWDALHDWTVTLGDVTFLIPPTQISIQTEIDGDSMAVIRGKGTAYKTKHRTLRHITMTVYFYGDNGINGYPLKTTLPNGTKITYYMNGLRALLSQFKFIPFVPIKNNYINDTLGVDAVMVNSINIENQMNIGPQLMKATIVLTEFDYDVYLSNHTITCLDWGFTEDIFGKAFNWPTARYYYQRAVLAGQELRNATYQFNSPEYINAALGNRTTLQPMPFRDSTFSFYLADTTYLDDLLKKSKNRSMQDALYNVTPDEVEQVQGLAHIGEAILDMCKSEQFAILVDDVSKHPITIDKELSDIDHFDLEGPRNAFNEKTGKYEESTSKEQESVRLFGSLYGIRKRLRSMVSAALSGPDVDIPVSGTKIGNPYASLRMEPTANGMDVIILVEVPIQCQIIEKDNYGKFVKHAKLGTSAEYSTFDQNKITLPFRIKMKNKTNEDTGYEQASTLLADTTNGDFPILADIIMRANIYNRDDFKSTQSNVDATKEFKTSPLLVHMRNIKFNKLDCGNFVVTDVSCSLSNRFTNTTLISADAPSPQYLGGQSTIIELNINTTDEKTAGTFAKLPRIIASYTKRYKSIIEAFPLQVDSEFTRLLGITDVSILNANVSTVPNQPGVYNIKLRLLSIDRNLRTSEAIKMIQANNGRHLSNGNILPETTEDWRYNRPIGFIDGLFWGARRDFYDSVTKSETKNIQSMFDIEQAISQVELYPDLELPTVNELKDIGLEFVRYKFQDNRVYVDPDFYFMYWGKLSSETLRETILNLNEQGITGETTLKDKDGAEITVAPADYVGFKEIASNEIVTRQRDIVKGIKNARSTLAAKRLKENLKEYKSMENTTESWDVGEDIKVIFMEDNYKTEYETNQNQKVAKTADTVTDYDIKKEGAWVAKELEKAKEAASILREYIDKNPIKDKFFSLPRYDWNREVNITTIKGYEQSIYNGVDDILNEQEVTRALTLLGIDMSERFKQITRDLIYAAACAATGNKKYSGKSDSLDWCPDINFIGELSSPEQDAGILKSAIDIDTALTESTIFSCFKIKQYNKDTFERITGEPAYEVWDDDPNKDNTTNTKHWLIDSYYRYKPVSDIMKYKERCISSPYFAAKAYMRIILYFLAKAIDNLYFPSINADILRKSSIQEKQIQEQSQENNVSNETDLAIKQKVSFFLRNSYAIDAAKIYIAVLMASTEMDQTLLNKIEKRDYRALSSFLESNIIKGNTAFPSDTANAFMQKYTLALVGLKHIDKKVDGTDQWDNEIKAARDYTEQKYIDAAEKPEMFITHACHDMITHDARGRMLRAFPTFYMLLIDEGKDIGNFHLHDNFYNTNSLLSLDVVKSRRLPADTAEIVLSNFYSSFITNEEEDVGFAYKYKSSGLIENLYEATKNTIFSTDYAEKEVEPSRKEKSSESRLKIIPGARIHIRLGYGSNAMMLPTVFNGVIAEVTTEDTINLIAQGDGIELTNPILEEMEAYELLNQDDVGRDWFRNGATPKEIMNKLLTTTGGWWADLLNKYDSTRSLLGRNPYGISHFGNPDFKEIIRSGEPTQNIFEIAGKTKWNNGDLNINLEESPHITFDLFGKTPWDIVNICRSVNPDFICAVAPFMYRSTLFMGLPRYYYAYGYTNQNGALQELRKPYQQYHIYTSQSDIIGNGIAATQRDMKTAAIGLYKETESLNIQSQQRVGPLFADIDIYPENQKTMIVDTQLIGKGIPILGGITNSITNMKIFGSATDDKGRIVDNEKIAWRMTASALRDSIKDMYTGDMTVIGDPTVKPHDRISIEDIHEAISGQALVKEVVHHLSVDDGFITSISPDCITTVDDPFEITIQQQMKTVSYIGASEIFLAGYLLSAWKKNPLWLPKKMTSAKGLGLAKKAKDLAGSIKKSKQVTEAVKVAKKIKGAKKVINTAKTGMALLALTGVGAPAAAFAAVMTTVIGAGIEMIGSAVSSAIDRYTRNLEVVRIFPLKRHRYVMVAGLGGSKGIIYGSPSFNQQGLLQQTISNVIGIDEESGTFATILKSLFFDEEAIQNASRMSIANRDGSSPDSVGYAGDDDAFGDMIRTSQASPNIGKNIAPLDYRRLLIDPRASYNEAKSIKESYDFFAIKNAEQFHNDKKLNNLVFIGSNQRLKPYIDEGFFRILHASPELKADGGVIDTQSIKLNGEIYTIKVIKYITNSAIKKDAAPAIVYDIPMLNPDALDVLIEIIRRTKLHMPSATSSDSLDSYNKTKDSFICLESATRCGDTLTLASAGFTFILTATGLAEKALRTALKEFNEELKQEIEKNPYINTELFMTKELNRDTCKIAVVVSMPKLSGAEKKQPTIKRSPEARS